MSGYGIGFDIGISSVGWAIVKLDEDEKPSGIIDIGSRIFDAAEVPKTGASLALPRREARSARRRIRRAKYRLKRIRELLIKRNIIHKDDPNACIVFGDESIKKEAHLEDIYKLRVRALDESVDNLQFARILIHIAQRRGYKSNRKNEIDLENEIEPELEQKQENKKGKNKKDDENKDKKEKDDKKKLLKAVKDNSEKIGEGKDYRTPGEMFLKDPRFKDSKRNKPEEYYGVVSRSMIEDEVRKIFKKQRELGNKFASEDIEQEYCKILMSQRRFDKGPGGRKNSQSLLEKMVGQCTLEPGEKRAAKATYSFQYFDLLCKINNIRIFKDVQFEPLTQEQREKLIELFHKQITVKCDSIRSELELNSDQFFKGLNYTKKKEIKCMKLYGEIMKAFNKLEKDYIKDMFRRDKKELKDKLNAIGETLTLQKYDDDIEKKLKEYNLFTPEEIRTVLKHLKSFSGFGHLSVKACDKLIPYLEKGLSYDKACEAAGYNFKGHGNSERKTRLVLSEEKLNELTNPVVKRSICQTLKVLNAIIKYQGSVPTFVNIELAREMSRSKEAKKKTEDYMKQKEKEKESAETRFKELYEKETGTSNNKDTFETSKLKDKIKMMLYIEQDCRCAYSQKFIPASKLFDEGYVEIDHIIPYSISFDNGYNNKVLVLAEENQKKKNRLPLEYLTGEKREKFISYVNNTYKKPSLAKKKQNLLKEQIDENEKKDFKERNLNDTRYACRFVMNYINDNLEFADSKRKKHVTATNGFITSCLRGNLRIQKNRSDGDMHHAVDALIIACTNESMIQKISNYSQQKESRCVKKPKFPEPWHNFCKELDEYRNTRFIPCSPDPKKDQVEQTKQIERMESVEDFDKKLIVSRVPRCKITGAAHEETIRRLRCYDENLFPKIKNDTDDKNKLFTVTKAPLKKIKLDKNGEIKNYFNPESDKLLYESLKHRLIEFKNKYPSDKKYYEKAFKEPFYKPKKDGTDGNIVRSVKTYETVTLFVPVNKNKGVADNGKMVRVDVFHVTDGNKDSNGYYFVPIYVSDTVKPKLPNKACVASKSYDDWREMREEDFIFSLYKNDLLYITEEINTKKSDKNSVTKAPQECKTESELLYFCSANIHTASFTCYAHDGGYEKRGRGIKGLLKLEKYRVDILGRIHRVEKEKRMTFGNKK